MTVKIQSRIDVESIPTEDERDTVKREGLREINRLRREWEMAPLTHLPEGTPHDCGRCTVARALYSRVRYDGVPVKLYAGSLSLCSEITKLSLWFDAQRFPELIGD